MFIYPCDPRYKEAIGRLPCVVEYDGYYWELRLIEDEYIFVAIDVYPDYGDDNGEECIQTNDGRQGNF